MPTSVAWANGLRTNTACAMSLAPAVRLPVVDEGALADQQLAVLDAAYLCPQQRRTEPAWRPP